MFTSSSVFSRDKKSFCSSESNCTGKSAVKRCIILLMMCLVDSKKQCKTQSISIKL